MRQTVELHGGESFEVWCARPEDVIVGKLMAWAEGHSRKHETDIYEIMVFHSPDQARHCHLRYRDSRRYIPEPIPHAQFESLVTVETRRIQDCLMDTLQRSGFSPDWIDAVVRTGGSAQIPRFVELLDRSDLLQEGLSDHLATTLVTRAD